MTLVSIIVHGAFLFCLVCASAVWLKMLKQRAMSKTEQKAAKMVGIWIHNKPFHWAIWVPLIITGSLLMLTYVYR